MYPRRRRVAALLTGLMLAMLPAGTPADESDDTAFPDGFTASCSLVTLEVGAVNGGYTIDGGSTVCTLSEHDTVMPLADAARTARLVIEAENVPSNRVRCSGGSVTSLNAGVELKLFPGGRPVVRDVTLVLDGAGAGPSALLLQNGLSVVGAGTIQPAGSSCHGSSRWTAGTLAVSDHPA